MEFDKQSLVGQSIVSVEEISETGANVTLNSGLSLWIQGVSDPSGDFKVGQVLVDLEVIPPTNYGRKEKDIAYGSLCVVRSDCAPGFNDGDFPGYWTPGSLVVEYLDGAVCLADPDVIRYIPLDLFLSKKSRMPGHNSGTAVRSYVERNRAKINACVEEILSQEFTYIDNGPWWDEEAMAEWEEKNSPPQP